MDKDKIGFSFGRFQPFHIGHIEYIEESLRHANHLLIGITNPDPCITKYHPDSIHRALPSSNPFTYFERMVMIKESLLQIGYNRNHFEIIPFPINFPEKFKYYIPQAITVYLSICEKWGYTKLKTFDELKYSIKVLFEKSESEKLTSGKEIRNLISNDLPWNSLVPNAVAEFIKSNQLEQRVKHMIKAEQSH